MTTTDNSPEVLADRLEEAALASLPFGSGELAQALAEANAVRRGESALLAGGSGPTGRNLAEACQPATEQATQAIARDARIARAAEGLLAAGAKWAEPSASGVGEAWDRLVEAVEAPPGGEPETPAARLRPCPACVGTGWAAEGEGGEPVSNPEDWADDYAVDPGEDGPEERARLLRRDTLLDFAALLAPEGGAE